MMKPIRTTLLGGVLLSLLSLAVLTASALAKGPAPAKKKPVLPVPQEKFCSGEYMASLSPREFIQKWYAANFVEPIVRDEMGYAICFGLGVQMGAFFSRPQLITDYGARFNVDAYVQEILSTHPKARKSADEEKVLKHLYDWLSFFVTSMGSMEHPEGYDLQKVQTKLETLISAVSAEPDFEKAGPRADFLRSTYFQLFTTRYPANSWSKISDSAQIDGLLRAIEGEVAARRFPRDVADQSGFLLSYFAGELYRAALDGMDAAQKERAFRVYEKIARDKTVQPFLRAAALEAAAWGLRDRKDPAYAALRNDCLSEFFTKTLQIDESGRSITIRTDLADSELAALTQSLKTILANLAYLAPVTAGTLEKKVQLFLLDAGSAGTRSGIIDYALFERFDRRRFGVRYSYSRESQQAGLMVDYYTRERGNAPVHMTVAEYFTGFLFDFAEISDGPHYRPGSIYAKYPSSKFRSGFARFVSQLDRDGNFVPDFETWEWLKGSVSRGQYLGDFSEMKKDIGLPVAFGAFYAFLLDRHTMELSNLIMAYEELGSVKDDVERLKRYEAALDKVMSPALEAEYHDYVRALAKGTN